MSNNQLHNHSILHDNPCVKDCPDRNSECHAKCKKYLEFAKNRQKFNEEKFRQNQLYSFKK